MKARHTLRWVALSGATVILCAGAAGSAMQEQKAWLVEKSKTIFTPRVDAENLAEIDGIVGGNDSRGRSLSPQPRAGTLEELQLAGDSLPRDRAVLERAYASSSVAIRATAVRLLGRMETAFPDKSATDAWFGLNDADAAVRREAANAIGQGHAGDASLSAADWAKVNSRDRSLLEAHIKTERDDGGVGTMLQALGRLHFDATNTSEVERLLISQTSSAPMRRLGALLGLATLTTPRDAKARVEPATRARLRELATTITPGASDDISTRVRRMAIQLLQSLNDTDAATIVAAAKDPDWQVRRFAVMMTSLDNDVLRPSLEAALKDDVFEVRWEALRVAARGITGTTPCTPLIEAIEDSEPTVVIQALSLLKTSCPERDAIVKKIIPLAESLRTATDKWQVPAAALTALSKLSSSDAKRILPTAVGYKTWEVRAAAAGVAGAMGDEATVVQLAHDPAANVRNAAIEALQQMKSPALGKAATDALGSNDHQLVRTAARTLAGTAMKDEATTALLGSLDRLTKAGKDNSRDARTAILDRLKEVMPTAKAELLTPYLTDFDPVVAASAAAIMMAKGVTGVSANPHLRTLEEPSLAELRALPTQATIRMSDGGTVELELLAADAPITVWRFAMLAKKGYYNGLTFHRIVPNFVVQGGSPGANEYVGDVQYMRDEEGLASNLRGAVGISTRGRDTGDAQIFVDLIDLPRLDHDYTVFARVKSGMPVVDRMLEGARIATMTIR